MGQTRRDGPGSHALSRTLVLSLLRAGDALVHLPALAALRAADPGGELHLLVQAASGPAVELLATQATVHRLPVDHTGGPPGPCGPLLEALRALRFDLLVNLTHRRFAAELAAQLGVARTLGLTLVDGRPAASSPWLTALNDWGTSAPLSVLHYADVACQSLGLPAGDPRLRERLPAAAGDWWRVTRAGLGLAPGEPFLALQLTTSEPKKSWPLDRWRALAQALGAAEPGLRLVALAAPAEVGALSAALQGSATAVVPCTLAQAARLLADATLLVSGDTSLVHLAGLAGARVLLLSSGSSAFRELGPAGPGHAVLQARWPCAPCGHDPGCLVSAGGHPCTTSIEPNLVAETALALAAGGAPQPPPPGAPATLFRSALDRRGLATFAPAGWAPPDTACAELLREHLLAGLPIAPGPGSGPAAGPRRPAPQELGPLAELLSATVALRAEAEGRAQGAAARLLPSLGSPFAMAFTSAVAARLGEHPGGPHARIAAELGRLEARLRAVPQVSDG